jgi:manganese/zinc/iron transport system ATP- binding protein
MALPLELAARDGISLSSAGAASPAALSVAGLTVAYGQKPAISDINLDITSARMTAIVGPNGAGKSTFLKAMMGLVPSLSGQVRFFGGSLDAARARVGYVPQRASVDWDFPARVIDVVLMGLHRQIGPFRWAGARHRAKALACLSRVGMSEFAERQIGQLSGGQQQRVFLARALAQGADLYLLDEPFAGVDAATERAIIEVLRDLKAEGATIVCVHHDLSTVDDYFDDVVLIQRQLIASGPVEAVFTEQNLQAAYGGQLAATQITGLAGQT